LKRDVAIIPWNDEEDLVIATDNSGSTGMRNQDVVQVPYDIVSYFSFRVAWMECVAAGAEPIAVVLHNFSGDEAWKQLIKGIERGMKELEINELQITGSTETNFSFALSAVGMSIIGRRKKEIREEFMGDNGHEKIKAAVIGEPLVGIDVIKNKHVAPLKLFQWFAGQRDVLSLLPVGSKGILYELKQLFAGQSWRFTTDLDMEQTSGPATCFIVAYKEEASEKVKEKAGEFFHEVTIEQI
jgi:hypothetical protein